MICWHRLPQAIFVQSDYKIHFCNRAFLRLLGAENESQVLGSSPLDFVPPESHELVSRSHSFHARETRAGPCNSIRLAAARRKRVPVVASAAPTLDLGRLAFVVSIQDITELRHAEQEMRRNEHRFRTLVQPVSQLVWRADPR